MDTVTVISSVLSSLGVSLSGAWWLSQQLISQRLAKEKDLWQAGIRKEVEVYLGEKSAEREYNLEAKKRLYAAIGPLRFQLLLACRDVTTRMANFSQDHRSYGFGMGGYYGQSTLYRLLRPVAISELIERQITYADFSVDPGGIDLLRFKKAAFTAFTDGDILLQHPGADWSRQKEHLFSGTLSTLANQLIIPDANVAIKDRPIHFHEFQSLLANDGDTKRFSPLDKILDNFSIAEKPIFWLRLVCFGFVCNEYLGSAGNAIGAEKLPYDVLRMLSLSSDPFIRSHVNEYEAIFRQIIKRPL